MIRKIVAGLLGIAAGPDWQTARPGAPDDWELRVSPVGMADNGGELLALWIPGQRCWKVFSAVSLLMQADFEEFEGMSQDWRRFYDPGEEDDEDE